MLPEYKRKRDFKITPEPPGADKSSGERDDSSLDNGASLTFVIQKHHARRLHYDFRLEIDGVLVSWAVPKGPSLNPAEKRFAVMTEDHPLEYAQFEGVIPERQYGAGEVIIWDRGTYSPDEELKYSWQNKLEASARMRDGLGRGKLSFHLKGGKLEGSWTLVKLHNKEKEWLLIKHQDRFANTHIDVTADDAQVASEKGGSFEKIGKQAPYPLAVSPMLASLADGPFVSASWFFEPKLDGVRAIAFLKDGACRLSSRRGTDLTRNYPSVAQSLSGYVDDFIFDGEVVAIDSQGRPSFQFLQQSSGALRSFGSKDKVKSKVGSKVDSKAEIVFYVFDILYARGRDLTALPIETRKAFLQEVLRTSKCVRLVQSLGHDGEAVFSACVEMGLEGIVGKQSQSRYELGRRSKSWLKLKTNLSGEFLVCGYTEGTGSRLRTFGSLILGEYDSHNVLVYIGGVGTGLDSNKLDYLIEKMTPLITKRCPFKRAPAGKLNPTWIKPELVVEVKFMERTQDNILRAPVYLQLREDIEPADVKPTSIVRVSDVVVEQIFQPNSELVPEDQMKEVPAPVQSVLQQLDNETEKLNLEVDGNVLPLTNLNKVFWPAHGDEPAITKRDYLLYLAKISQYVIPHLTDRLITLVRFPNGINAGRFYQKHWEKGLPKFVQTIRVFTEHENRDQDFLVCNNLSTLLWLGQVADLELHTSHTRINPQPDATDLPMTMTGSVQELEASIMNYPDYVILDLDPYLYSGKEDKGAEPELHQQGFKDCCQVAMYLKKVLDSIKVDTFIKTSGKTGLHIYIPIKRTIDYDTVRALSEVICRQVLKEHPEKVTMDWAIVKRTGKVFMDHNMNARSKSLASIYSPRVAPEACVSTPLNWDELNSIYPTDFTMRSLPERLAVRGDLWSDILSHKHDLMAILARDGKSTMPEAIPTVENKRLRMKKQKMKRSD